MGQLIAVAIGGATGSILRFLLSRKIQVSINSGFPYGILVVNFLGCFLMGILATLFLERFNIPPIWRAGILIGFLGGFTTFSSFTNDTLNMIQLGDTVSALSYIFLSVILCLLATWIGILLVRSI